jgi:hypothetical protein
MALEAESAAFRPLARMAYRLERGLAWACG